MFWTRAVLSLYLVTKVPRLNTFPHKCVFELPCLMQANDFVTLVRRRTHVLVEDSISEKLKENPSLRSRAFDEEVSVRVREQFMQLLELRERDVEDLVFDKYGYKDQRLVTCIVPYQVGANIILQRLPPALRGVAVAELKEQEKQLADLPKAPNSSLPTSNSVIQWVERDVYRSSFTPRGSGARSVAEKHRRRCRIPIWAVLGHVDHGKTTLLDALQGSSVAAEEGGGITQSVRAFTISVSQDSASACEPRSEAPLVPYGYPSSMTLIDTPGHFPLGETRFHAQIAADYILLIVAANEGVQSQTVETIKIALNVDRPLVVAINKMDMFTSASSAKMAVNNVLAQLANVGLDVHMVFSEKDLSDVCRTTRTSAGDVAHASSPTDGPHADGQLRTSDDSRAAASSLVSTSTQAPSSLHHQVFLPMKDMDASYKGNLLNPVMELRRRCLGVCISAKHAKNLKLLREVMREAALAKPPMAVNDSADYTNLPSTVQAIVLESSKHLFDEEGFRLSRTKQKMMHAEDAAAKQRSDYVAKIPVPSRIRSTMSAPMRKAQSRNPTNTDSLIISAIVKQGTVTRGMPFVADQGMGVVEHIMDFFGNPLKEAPPGAAVVLVDRHSVSGCPGACTHVLSIPSKEKAHEVFRYRRLLQWFVECFPTRLAALKPRGMNVTFTHLGDYGQLQISSSLEFHLLYGPPPPPSPELAGGSPEHNPQHLLSSTSSSPGDDVAQQTAVVGMPERETAISFGQLMRESNAEAASQYLQSLSAKEDGNKRDVFMSIESAWSELQPTEPLHTMEEYESFERQRLHIGIFVKVDSWHSARLFVREATRLGTKRVSFAVVGVRFGELTSGDMHAFSSSAKIIVCYRTPRVSDPAVDKYLEALDTWFIDTDQFMDVIMFLKSCAVELHKQNCDD